MSPESSEIPQTTHHVIIIPGLGGRLDNAVLGFVTRNWSRFGLTPHILSVGWRDTSTSYGQKLEMVTDMVQELSSQGQVTIIGASAGGSMALNAFLEKPEIIHRVISICSRLRPGTLDKLDWRTLDRMASSSKAFKESVERIAEQVIPDTLKDKIMTVTARFGDELVPKTTSFIEGAYNITIPFGEHVVSILLTLTLFRGRIIEFIQLNESE